MVRKLVFIVAAVVCVAASASMAAAQAPGPAVVADPPVERPQTVGGGALTQTAAPTLTGLVAVYAGLSLLGGTLATIVRQRRSRRRTELKHGSRSHEDSWVPVERSLDVPELVSGSGQARVYRLIASADTDAVSSHRSTR